MNADKRSHSVPDRQSGKPDDNVVERAAKYIVPPGTDVDDEEIQDPGRMTPDAQPSDNRS